jgi:hypothetical protein
MCPSSAGSGQLVSVEVLGLGKTGRGERACAAACGGLVVVGRVEKSGAEAVAAAVDAALVALAPDPVLSAAAGGLVAPGIPALAASAVAGGLAVASGTGQAVTACPFGILMLALLAEMLVEGVLGAFAEGRWDGDKDVELDAARNHSRYPRAPYEFHVSEQKPAHAPKNAPKEACGDFCLLRTFEGKTDAWSKGCNAIAHVYRCLGAESSLGLPFYPLCCHGVTVTGYRCTKLSQSTPQVSISPPR